MLISQTAHIASAGRKTTSIFFQTNLMSYKGAFAHATKTPEMSRMELASKRSWLNADAVRCDGSSEN
jgi:hypothetical protein